jgi:hypothetical protein
MLRIFGLILLISGMAMTFACGGPGPAGGGDTPTEAYKRLYAAVKSKNVDSVKENLTKKTLDFAVSVSQRNNTPLEKVFENGFTATTFAESLPEIRDERVKENMASVEVYNSKDKIWEDLPFILEDGKWKLAVGDIFAGSFKSPGPGRAIKEKEAANAMNPNQGQVIQPAANANLNVAPMNKAAEEKK